MKIIIHRGTHQIGGVATEIATDSTRIIIDMGDELSLEPNFIPMPIDIDGVTNNKGTCDAVLFTHNHGDHIGQYHRIREDIPLYIGSLSKEIFLISDRNSTTEQKSRIVNANVFEVGKNFVVGDISITPFSIDHSACDSYMFLIEAEGKKILHTGDFRMHGFRGKGVDKIIKALVGKVDVLITEGTTLSRALAKVTTEQELQSKLKEYIKEYKYVFILAATTNLERIYAFSHATPRGKYFLCDSYQKKLMESIEKHWSKHSGVYKIPKVIVYGDNLLDKIKERGCVMMVRNNRIFQRILKQFDPSQSIIIYSMWDGYRTKPDSTISDFLKLVNRWESLHTSGHASVEDIGKVIEFCNPSKIIWIHADKPEKAKEFWPNNQHITLYDKEEYVVQ